MDRILGAKNGSRDPLHTGGHVAGFQSASGHETRADTSEDDGIEQGLILAIERTVQKNGRSWLNREAATPEQLSLWVRNVHAVRPLSIFAGFHVLCCLF